ncbi:MULTISPECIES: hypothetical protein [Mycolicibacterium]|uniref:ESX-1 secretion-associated protein n=2 Tax=Mycolicibacterium TaxID=1866885 RepID=A0ABV3VPQ9_9MYCO|nr:hypothetical protein [Mycolicibacterium peregrinum]
MSGNEISLDQDQAAAAAAQWREYADQVETHGRSRHVPPEMLRSMLGDVYDDYIQSKQSEYSARESAYARVAAQTRSHADKLDNTNRILTEGDENAAASFGALID